MPSGGGVKKNTLSPGLKRIISKYPKVVSNALYAEVEIEITEVKRRTPVDLGDLKGSIHQEGPDRKGNRIFSTIVAGGEAADYAAIVHEDLDAFHEVGQAKYIESVIFESKDHMADRVSRRIHLNRAK